MKNILSLIFLAGLLFFNIQTVNAQGGQGGPLILMGIDAEDGGVGGHGNINIYVAVSNTLTNAASNGGNGYLVIGGGKSPTDHVTQFWNEISLRSGIPVTYVNGEFNIESQSFAGFRVLVVVSDNFNTPSGGLTAVENLALTTRRLDIANFVNNGGGLLGFSQTAFPQPYSYLSDLGDFTINIPAQYENITPTPEGIQVGITDGLDICCWHDEYITFPTFLRVLATNVATGSPAAIGGLNVFLSSIQLSPIQAELNIGQPHTLTASVMESGQPFPNTLVTFNVLSGPNMGQQFTQTTNAQGQASVSYTSTTVGTDMVRASYVSPGATPTPTPLTIAAEGSNEMIDFIYKEVFGYTDPDPKVANLPVNAAPEGTGGTVILSNTVTVNWISANLPPDCSNASPSVALLPVPNRTFRSIEVLGVTDPDGDPVTISVTGIGQDEPIDHIGNGDFTPDGVINGSTAMVRAESIIGTVTRNGVQFVGNGRVYHIGFRATDITNASCTGVVNVAVPHVRTATPIDDGNLFTSAGQFPVLFSDFNGDHSLDFSIYRQGSWFTRRSSDGGMQTQQWGLGGDIPVPADYDGDGKTDHAVWRNVSGSGVFYILRSSTGSMEAHYFGTAGDNPTLVGDWDNDGQADLAVYRIQPNGQGVFYYRRSSSPDGGFVAFNLGLTGDIPVRGDFDGDGAFDLSVFRPATGVWYIFQSSNNQFRIEQWGLNGDKPAAADFDGDSRTDIAVFRPSNGTWYIRQSMTNHPRYEHFGTSGDKVVANDYDGDGQADIAVWREGSPSYLYVLRSSDNGIETIHWGTTGDKPVFEQ